MDLAQETYTHLVLMAWSGLTSLLLAVLGVIMWWNWRSLYQRVDTLDRDKADKDDVERRHVENRATMARIETAVISGNTEARTSRENLALQVQTLVGKVGKIEGQLERITK